MKKYYSLMMTALVLCFSLTLAAKAYFEDYPPTPCPYEDAPHHNPNLAVAVQDMAELSGAIIMINGWNRLAIPFRDVPGVYQPKPRAKVAATD